MKKLFISALLAGLSATSGYAQHVNNFDVGPYEVDYRNEDDFKFRLRKGIDLYDYFGLQRDTVVQILPAASEPVKHAFQLDLSFSLPAYISTGASTVWGIDGIWKQRIGKAVYFNAGVSLGASFGKYSAKWNNRRETILEIGIPLSVEFTRLDRRKASVYCAVGIRPIFYATVKAKETYYGIHDAEKESGLLIAPRADIGGYIPVGSRMLRLGFFAEYNIDDLYKERIGACFVGLNVGLVF